MSSQPSSLRNLSRKPSSSTHPKLNHARNSRQTHPVSIIQSIYFENFPSGWDARSLWCSFSQLGRIDNIYIPNKLSHKGRRFGFICTSSNGFYRLLNAINGIRIGSYNLRAFKSRYGRGKAETGKVNDTKENRQLSRQRVGAKGEQAKKRPPPIQKKVYRKKSPPTFHKNVQKNMNETRTEKGVEKGVGELFDICQGRQKDGDAFLSYIMSGH